MSGPCKPGPHTFLKKSPFLTIACRTVGALLMFITGVVYLLAENTIEKRHRDANGLTNTIGSLGSRVIMGIQVGS